MAGEWNHCTLGEVCDFRAGVVFKPALQGKTSGDYPFIKVSDMNLPANAVRIQTSNNWVSVDDLPILKAKLLPPGTVVFAKIGEALRQNRLREVVRETLIDNNMMGALPNPDRVDPKFLYYAMSQYDFSEIAQGTALPYITVSSLSALSLDLPTEEEEQRAIAKILTSLDDKIELNRRMNETLESIAKAIFKSWFIDFDPVRAKVAGEPPESICRRLGLTPALLALFPNRLVDSELGDIPEGWSTGNIADHCYLNAQSWVEKTLPAEVHYVDLANVKNGIISQAQKFLSLDAPSRARRVLRAGDTIVGTVRPRNRSFALVGIYSPQLTGSTGFAVLTPRREQLRELVYLLATTEENISRMSHLADGAAYPAVHPDVVTAGPCVVPPPVVIDAFHKVVCMMLDLQEANRVNDTVIATIRDALLPKLLSGNLRVSLEGVS